MELKPVVHNNDRLNFEASNELTNMIAFFKRRLLSITVSLWAIFLSGSIKLFHVSGRSINLPYLLAEIALIVVAVFGSYDLVNKVVLVIAMIGRQVSITNETVSIMAFTFNLRFWNKKAPQTLVFKIDELKIRKTDNPLRFIRLSDNFDYRVFELRDKTRKAYIVFDYFDVLLKEKLTEILVGVTLPELLIPGRLRHH